jgi:hypothetical protein
MLGLPDLNFLTMSEIAEGCAAWRRAFASRRRRYRDGALHNIPAHRRGLRGSGGERDFTGGPSDTQALRPFCQQTGHSWRGNGVKDQSGRKARSNPDFVILARSDARQMNGLDDAIERVNRCCDSGAWLTEKA